MYKFLLYQWQLGKITEEHLELAVDKGWITSEEKEAITGSTPE